MSVTIADIAADARVSVPTVSRVINGADSVSEELRERVIRSVEKMNYKPSAAARSLITKRSNIIAVVEADITNPVTARILWEIDDCCMKNNKIMLTCNYDFSNEKAIFLLDKLLERSVDGLIFMGVCLEEKLLAKLREFSCPVVLAQQGVESDTCEFITVTDDSYHAARDVTDFLIQAGHQRIAYLGGDANDYTNGKLRLKGYLDKMQENGLEVPQTYIWQGAFSVNAGFRGMQEVYEKSLKLPTAVVCGSDMIAVGAIRFLKSVGLKVPQDISVFGFDDSVSDIFEIPLSTVRSCNRGEILCEQLFKKRGKDEKKEWVYYPYQVLRRNSTRRCQQP